MTEPYYGETVTDQPTAPDTYTGEPADLITDDGATGVETPEVAIADLPLTPVAPFVVTVESKRIADGSIAWSDPEVYNTPDEFCDGAEAAFAKVVSLSKASTEGTDAPAYSYDFTMVDAHGRTIYVHTCRNVVYGFGLSKESTNADNDIIIPGRHDRAHKEGARQLADMIGGLLGTNFTPADKPTADPNLFQYLGSFEKPDTSAPEPIPALDGILALIQDVIEQWLATIIGGDYQRADRLSAVAHTLNGTLSLVVGLHKTDALSDIADSAMTLLSAVRAGNGH